MATNPWYATREQVQRALDVAETARADGQIDQALASGVDTIHGDLHRVFYPQVDVRTFDWPNDTYSRAWRLWLWDDELVSVTAVTNGDGEILTEGTDFFLAPEGGPPYSSVEINRGSASGWSPGASTSQRAISIAGTFGYQNTEAPAGSIAEALDASETDVEISDGSLVGVGDLVRCGDERMVVTGRTWVDSGQNTGAALDAMSNDVAVTVSDGTAFHAGEQLTIDVERMLVLDVVGNVLSVKRAYRGSVLAAHSLGADVYVDRVLTVERGALGTTAAAHDDGATLVRWCPPPLIRSLNLALALVTFEQEKASYGRTVGAGETEREARGPALHSIREQAWTRFARQARLSAI